jgi:hypothetical protein
MNPMILLSMCGALGTVAQYDNHSNSICTSHKYESTRVAMYKRSVATIVNCNISNTKDTRFSYCSNRRVVFLLMRKNALGVPSAMFVDADGRKWARMNTNTHQGPPYPIDAETNDRIRAMLDPCELLLVELPFFTLPMWPVSLDYVQSPTDFCYCVCAVCGTILQEPGRLTLEFALFEDKRASWRPRLLCSACIQSASCTLTNASYYSFALFAQHDLQSVIANAWDAQPPAECRVCAVPLDNPNKSLCTSEQCKQIVPHLLPASAGELLMDHFYRVSLDVCSVLRFHQCHRVGCTKMLGQPHALGCVPFDLIWRLHWRTV